MSARFDLTTRFRSAADLPLARPTVSGTPILPLKPEFRDLLELAMRDDAMQLAARQLAVRHPSLDTDSARAAVGKTAYQVLLSLSNRLTDLSDRGLDDDVVSQLSAHGASVALIDSMARRIVPQAEQLVPVLQANIPQARDPAAARRVALNVMMAAWGGGLESKSHDDFLQPDNALEFTEWVANRAGATGLMHPPETMPLVAHYYRACRRAGWPARLIRQMTGRYAIDDVYSFAKRLGPSLPKAAVNDLLALTDEQEKFKGKPMDDVAKIVTATVARNDHSSVLGALHLYCE
ncbi:Uncharacterised protein [uncultured archaeon]|nr:Uncharacterised protein [uncultured archaeon]